MDELETQFSGRMLPHPGRSLGSSVGTDRIGGGAGPGGCWSPDKTCTDRT